jgi:hypothetical protein
MELTEHPDGVHAPLLRKARDLAHLYIADNPMLALTSVHADALGNYNPALEQSQEARNSQTSLKQKRDTPVPTSQKPEEKSPSPTLTPYTSDEDFTMPEPGEFPGPGITHKDLKEVFDIVL